MTLRFGVGRHVKYMVIWQALGHDAHPIFHLGLHNAAADIRSALDG